MTGRPSNKEIAANSKGGRGKVGRPKGDAGIINEYKARMLASPKSRKVLEAIFDVAMDPEHKNWPAASKMVLDRILPVAAFEKDVVQNMGGTSIQVNIVGVPGVEVKEAGKTFDNDA